MGFIEDIARDVSIRIQENSESSLDHDGHDCMDTGTIGASSSSSHVEQGKSSEMSSRVSELKKEGEGQEEEAKEEEEEEEEEQNQPAEEDGKIHGTAEEKALNEEDQEDAASIINSYHTHVLQLMNSDGHAIEEHDDAGNTQEIMVQPKSKLIYTLRRKPKRSRKLFEYAEFEIRDVEEQAHNLNVSLPKMSSSSSSSSLVLAKGSSIVLSQEDEEEEQGLADKSLVPAISSPSNSPPTFVNISMQTPSNTASTAARANVVRCSECGKPFSSWKALFGHMRCHPERQWRGIHPPNSRYNCFHVYRRRPNTASTVSDYRSTKVAAANLNTSEKFSLLTECAQQHSHVASKGISRRDKVIIGEDTTTQFDEEEGDHGNDDDDDEEEYDDEDVEVMELGRNQPLLHAEAGLYDHMQTEISVYSQSLHRGKRSRRSRLTLRSVRAVESLELGMSTAEEPVSKQLEEMQEEERDMAECLVMLAFAGRKQGQQLPMGDRGELREGGGSTAAQSKLGAEAAVKDDGGGAAAVRPDGGVARFECGACKRSFRSHQALGGHRASHKKVKGCFAKSSANLSDQPGSPPDVAPVDLPFPLPTMDPTPLHGHAHTHTLPLLLTPTHHPNSYNKSRDHHHQCSICLRTFPTGQALGGHKRCHWIASDAPPLAAHKNPPAILSHCRPSPPPHTSTSFFPRPKTQFLLDLNLPAPIDNDNDSEKSNGLVIALTPPAISSSPLDSNPPSTTFLHAKMAASLGPSPLVNQSDSCAIKPLKNLPSLPIPLSSHIPNESLPS